MIPTFSRNMPLAPLEPWMRALRIFSLIGHRTARARKKGGVKKCKAAAPVARCTQKEIDIQRRFFTGNFCAGPAALIHPGLLVPEKKAGE